MNKIEAVNLILEDIQDNYLGNHTVNKKHELHVECPECMALIFEGYLVWYRDLLEWGENAKN